MKCSSSQRIVSLLASRLYPRIILNSIIGWGEYLGYIDVTYSPSGTILSYHGAPIHLTNSTAQNPHLQTQIKTWRLPFEAFAASIVGFSSVILDQTTCQQRECLLGDFMTDAMLAYRKPQNPSVSFALINAGGIRATINEGNITRGEVLTSFPFGNAIVEIVLGGEELWKTLEGAVSKVNQYNGAALTSAIQVSRGINITYNPTNAVGSRLISVDLMDGPLSYAKNYTIVTLDFLAGGMYPLPLLVLDGK
jgi:2',3'-cyclic-nucleotide 2'-phosphodiesterase (5'-nucleotidase family)